MSYSHILINMNITYPKNISTIIKILNKNGYESYIVGGCVRDMLCGIKPHDYDITTNACPDEILSCFGEFKTLSNGKKHGTITVIYNHEPIEITSFRIDGEYTDNRHPDSVIFTKNIVEDLKRRDFTMNAIAFNKECAIIDPFNGVNHIKEKRIVCVGDPDTRFLEDGLRIMRAIRFSSVLGFEISKSTKESIHKNKFLLKNISSERIYSELKKLICGKNSYECIVEYSDVLSIFIPNICTKYPLESLEPDLAINFALLLYYNTKEQIINVFSSLHSDKLIKTNVLDLIENKNMVFDNIKLSVSMLGFERIYRLLKFLKCIYYKDKQKKDFFISKISEVNILKKTNCCLFVKDLKITGKDLLEIGYNKDSSIKKTLNSLLLSVINNNIENEYNQLINVAKSNLFK